MLRILVNSIIRGWKQLARRPLYICMMVIVPLVSAWFFFDLMEDGVVRRSPVGIVDLDKSDMSRRLTRNLSALQQVEIKRLMALTKRPSMLCKEVKCLVSSLFPTISLPRR